MESKAEFKKDGLNCQEVGVIVREGHEFAACGSCVYENPGTGKIEGILYAPWGKTPEDVLSSWDGKLKVPAKVGSTWEGNFFDYNGRPQVNRSYWFTLYGRKCRGVNYNREFSQIVRFKEI